MIYFLRAVGVPLYKIGHSQNPASRLGGCRTWSPIPLELVAVDEAGDALTEAIFKHKFWQYRSHGEWFFAVPEVIEVVEQTRLTGRMPGAVCFAEGYDQRRDRHVPVRGPTAELVGRTYGLDRNKLIEAVGLSGSNESYGFSAMLIVRMVNYLRENGHPDLTHHEFLALRDAQPAPQPASVA